MTELVGAVGPWIAVETKRASVKKDGTTVCPRCGYEAWPVRFGMWIPDPENPDPKAVMAGCVITVGQDPQWSCQNPECEYQWRVERRSRTRNLSQMGETDEYPLRAGENLPDMAGLASLRQDGVSLAEIADTLGVSPFAVWTALARGSERPSQH
ncbi:MAG: hypothetical protein ACQEXN_10265 [Actinomycetota bacterium]